MANVNWHLSGDFVGNCSCAYLACPCPASKFTAKPTRGWCTLCVLFHVDSGQFGDVNLDDLNVVMVCDAPGIMAEGNWSLGLIMDERASPEQTQALATILGGQAGGPMTAFAPWVGNFLGLENRPIHVEKENGRYAFSVGDLIDYETQIVPGNDESEPVYLDNVFHPAGSRVALARGATSRLHAFGLDFDGDPGEGFGVYAHFDWRVS